MSPTLRTPRARAWLCARCAGRASAWTPWFAFAAVVTRVVTLTDLAARAGHGPIADGVLAVLIVVVGPHLQRRRERGG